MLSRRPPLRHPSRTSFLSRSLPSLHARQIHYSFTTLHFTPQLCGHLDNILSLAGMLHTFHKVVKNAPALELRSRMACSTA
jgi:hypothetical protein